MIYDRFYNNYKDSIVYKISLKNKCKTEVTTSIEEVLDIVRLVHDLTCGLPQIIYLVGWQHDGHDSKYPSWGVVGNHCAGFMSSHPIDSLRALMREVRKYNAKISLHINMSDAYQNSPLWNEYVDKDLIARNTDGSLNAGCQWGGELAYNISIVKEWRAGRSQQRILELLDMLPELKESGTIHIDAFLGKGSPGDGISIDDDLGIMVKITDFWHEQGIDVTTEMLTTCKHIGYFPMVFHLNMDEAGRLKYPAGIICGGGSAWNSRKGVNFYNFDGWSIKFMSPAAGCLYEEAWGENYPDDITASTIISDRDRFIEKFFLTSVVCRFLNRFVPLELRQTNDIYEVRFSEGVVSTIDIAAKQRKIRQKERVVVDDGNIFVDLFNGNKPLMLIYSQNGFCGEVILPDSLKTRKMLKITTFGGEQHGELSVQNGKVSLMIQPGSVQSLH